MKRRLIYGLVISVLAVNFFAGAWVYLSSARAAEKNDAMGPSLDLFSDVLQKVRTDYVDGRNLTYRDLTYAAVKGMVNVLDPHSEFLDPAAYQDLQDDTEGQFGGLGLVVTVRSNYVTIVTPMEDTPGFRAGILAGDRIIKINGEDAVKMPLEDAVKRLRGKPGTQVNMTIQRPSSGMVKDFTLTRDIIQMEMVKDINGREEFPLPDDKIGYVCITQFGDNTGDELEGALRKFQAQGMKALILDLRWNPGGLLDEAVNVCQTFLPRGQLIVSTEGRDPAQNSVRLAAGRGDELHGMPVVILVNLSSASASEIVTGCLQDLHRAIILGEKTFGKGSVQSIFPLRRRLGAQAYDREVLHAEPSRHPRTRHHAGHRGANERRRGGRCCSSNARPVDLNRSMKPIACNSRKSRINNSPGLRICSEAFCSTTRWQSRQKLRPNRIR